MCKNKKFFHVKKQTFLIVVKFSCLNSFFFFFIATEKNSGATRVLKIKGDQVSLHNAALPGSTKVLLFTIFLWV